MYYLCFCTTHPVAGLWNCDRDHIAGQVFRDRDFIICPFRGHVCWPGSERCAIASVPVAWHWAWLHSLAHLCSAELGVRPAHDFTADLTLPVVLQWISCQQFFFFPPLKTVFTPRGMVTIGKERKWQVLAGMWGTGPQVHCCWACQRWGHRRKQYGSSWKN